MSLFSEESEQLIENSKYVSPDGHLDAKYVLVGEAPGGTEVRFKRPLIGYSGDLLMSLLDNVGVLRKHCYITNVIKEQPKNNNMSLFIKFNTRGKPTLTKEALDYFNLLQKELSQTTANVICAVGNVALFALTGKTGILKYRGSILESTLLPGRKVIPIIHPAAALRMHIYRMYIHLDLHKILKESEYPEIKRVPRELKIFPSYQESIAYLRSAKDCKQIALDIETSRATQEVSHISFAMNCNEAISIQFFKSGKNIFTLEEESNIWNMISDILENPNIAKIIQNASFDAWYLFRRYGIIIRNIRDTMIAMRITFPDFRSGLDFLCSMYTDVPYYKDEAKDHKNIGDEVVYAKYSARDSVVLPEIYKKEEEDLNKQGNFESFISKCNLIEPLIYMQERGVLVDIEGIKQEKTKAQERLRELEKEFKELVNIPDISLTSTKQLQNYFYITLGIKPFTKVSAKKDGSKHSTVTLDEKALKRLAVGTKTRKPRPEALLILEHRKLAKLDSTYYDVSDIDRDSRMRCSFNPVGAKTGRLSSSQNVFGTGMNMQNQPEAMRKFYLADPGYLLFDVDLSQAEWRIVAYLAMDYNMINTLEQKKDIHVKTASFIFKCRESEVSSKSGSAPKFGNGEQSQRFWGKKGNHSMNYDASAQELSHQLFIPLYQAKEIRASYLSGYPGIELTFWNGIKRQLDKNRTITDLFGKSYTFRNKIQDVYKSAYSYIPQSTVGTIINERGIQRIYQDQLEFENFELLLQVHDSIVFQVKMTNDYKKLARQLKLIKESLEQPLQYRNQTFTIPADFKCGLNWGKKGEKNPLGLDTINFDGTESEQLETIWKSYE